MSISGFWTAAPKVDPARQFRFRINMNDASGQPVLAWWAKTCDRPKINIPVLGKDEYYLGSSTPDVKPGEIVDFQPITMTFIDPVNPSTTTSIMKQLSAASGECFPRVNGAKLKAAFGEVAITQIDANGDAIEFFILKGAFPTSIDFGSLDYGNDEFVTITMTWEYTSFNYATGKSSPFGQEAVITSQKPKSKDNVKKLDGDYI